MGRAGLGGPAHLARRWWQAQRARNVDPVDERSVVALLSPAEVELYRAMAPADKAHAAQSAMVMIGTRASTEAVVAAALHDVGKTRAALGTSGRVVASLVTLAFGRARVARLASRSGLVGRLGAYADHDRIGAEMLAAAGSNAIAVAWAGEHHRPLHDSSLDPDLARQLWEADRA